ncbi:MAG: PfkB family carbohydrate kinase [Chitinophagales bacterium]|nr:PfkB family carbohydrate kinase [Chitinophagales bacterium]MDW8428382.1 PfkB family carbohydrate kinase [Chitinophagales bacterium]
MSAVRPFVVTVAGHDPSGGAGLSADIKTLECCGVMGLPVCSAITFQTEDQCVGVAWVPEHQILLQLELVVRKYRPSVAKIGLVQSAEVLNELVFHLKQWKPDIAIVWDPVLKSSSGFVFHRHWQPDLLHALLRQCTLVTPNADEACALTGLADANQAAAQLGAYTAVLVKSLEVDGYLFDLLAVGQEQHRLESEKLMGRAKHGSGCVLSSAIAAALAQGYPLLEACERGRAVVRAYLQSSESLLGCFSEIHLSS